MRWRHNATLPKSLNDTKMIRKCHPLRRIIPECVNFKMPSFPQSMIKFKYFYVKNHCQNECLPWGKIFGQLENYTPRPIYILNNLLRNFSTQAPKNCPKTKIQSDNDF